MGSPWLIPTRKNLCSHCGRVWIERGLSRNCIGASLYQTANCIGESGDNSCIRRHFYVWQTQRRISGGCSQKSTEWIPRARDYQFASLSAMEISIFDLGIVERVRETPINRSYLLDRRRVRMQPVASFVRLDANSGFS